MYLIPLLLFRLRRLLAAPLSVLPRVLLSVCRSSLFLSLYCSTGWAWMCLFRCVGEARGRQSHALLSGLLTGLCVLIEKRERRVELGLYVLSHSLYTAYNLAVDAHLTRYHPNLLYPLLAAALTVLITAFQEDTAHGADASRSRDSGFPSKPADAPLLRPSYTSLFAFFIGRRRAQAQAQAAQRPHTITPPPPHSSTSSKQQQHQHQQHHHHPTTPSHHQH